MHNSEHIKACHKIRWGGGSLVSATMRPVMNCRSCAPVWQRQNRIDMPFQGRVLHSLFSARISKRGRLSGSASERYNAASCPSAPFDPTMADAKCQSATGRVATAHRPERPVLPFISHKTFVCAGRLLAALFQRNKLIVAFGRGSENPFTVMGTKS